jgi:hypothetical protein
MIIALAGLRVAMAFVLTITGAIGLQSGIACQYDWATIGASILMFTWGVRWLLSAATLLMSAAAAQMSRAGDLLYAVGLAAAALLFAGQSLSEPWWPFGWWPLVVGVLFAAVAVVFARDFAHVGAHDLE